MVQIAPVWLDREATLAKVTKRLDQAAAEGAQLAVFGEALLPGYPFWPELTGGARFNDDTQKELFAHYAENAVDIDDGQLDGLCSAVADLGLAVYIGTIERCADRGGFSLYASLVYIDASGQIRSVHRKLVPT
jgi:nitrilase